jgi:hypothetical protein
MTFAELLSLHPWRPIPGCPGRFVLPGRSDVTPQDLLGQPAKVNAQRSSKASDEVLVTRFPDGGGLISYRHADGSFCHTLNDAEGFSRKLAQLELQM